MTRIAGQHLLKDKIALAANDGLRRRGDSFSWAKSAIGRVRDYYTVSATICA
jgi:hypothetical protein